MKIKVRFIGINPKQNCLYPQKREGYYSVDLPQIKKEKIETILLKFGIHPHGVAASKNGNVADLREEVEDGDQLDIFLMRFGG